MLLFEKDKSEGSKKEKIESIFYDLDPKYIRVVNPFYFRKKLGISFKTKNRNGAVYHYTDNNWLVHFMAELLYYIWGNLYAIFYALFILIEYTDENGNLVDKQIYRSYKLIKDMMGDIFSRRLCIVEIDSDKIDYTYFEDVLTERFKRRYGVPLEFRIYQGLEL